MSLADAVLGVVLQNSHQFPVTNSTHTFWNTHLIFKALGVYIMKTLTKAIATATLALIVVAPVSAAVQWCEISRSVNSAAGSDGNVYVNINNDTVTLSGFVDDYYTRNKVVNAVKEQGANKIVNHIFIR